MDEVTGYKKKKRHKKRVVKRLQTLTDTTLVPITYLVFQSRSLAVLLQSAACSALVSYFLRLSMEARDCKRARPLVMVRARATRTVGRDMFLEEGAKLRAWPLG